MIDARKAQTVTPVGVRALYERRSPLPQLTESPERIGRSRRRVEQLMSCVGIVTLPLAEDGLAVKVSAKELVGLADRPPALFVLLEVFDGRLLLEVPVGAAQFLQSRLIESGLLPANAEISPQLELAFLVARLLARHALPSRYGVRLLGVAAESETRSWSGEVQCSVQLRSADGALNHEWWSSSFDESLGQRLDWYADRRASAIAAERFDRIRGRLEKSGILG